MQLDGGVAHAQRDRLSNVRGLRPGCLAGRRVEIDLHAVELGGMFVEIARGEVGLLPARIDGIHALVVRTGGRIRADSRIRRRGVIAERLHAPERHDDLVAIQIKWRAVGQKVILCGSSDLLGRTHLDRGVGGDGKAADGSQRRIAEYALYPVAGAGKNVVLIFVDEGHHIAQREAAADGEARNHGDSDLDGAPGESVNCRRFERELEAHVFCRRARNQIEGQRGIEHPTARSSIHKNRNVDEAQGIGRHLKRKRVAGVDGRGRVVLGQRQHLERHLDLVLLVRRKLVMQPRVERLIGLRGLRPIAQAQIVLGQRGAQQLFVRCVAAGCHFIDKWLEQLHGLFEIVGAAGQYTAIQLRLLGWKLIELRGYSRVLVIGEEILNARVESEAARSSGL